MSKFYKGVILIVLSALGFSIMPVFVKLAEGRGVTVFTILFLRFFLAAAFFFAYILIKYRKLSITWANIGALFILGGIFYSLQSTFYLSSLLFISASLAVLMLYTYPIIVAILSFFFDKEKLTSGISASIAVTFIGVILVIGTSLGAVDIRGVLLAGGAAVIYSCYIVFGNRVVKQIQPVVTSAFVALFAAINLFIAALVTNKVNNILEFGWGEWMPIIGLSLCSTVLAILTFFLGLELLGPTKASILSMLEPLFTVVFSAFFLGESLTLYQMLGGGIVLAGAVLVVLSKGKADNGEKNRQGYDTPRRNLGG